jgi:U3 small nucleolar ribonucleoprotein component
LVYLVVDTKSISFEKKQLEIKEGRLWIVEVEKNATQDWKNQHELMRRKRGLDSILEWMK